MNTVTNLRKLADYIEQNVPQKKLDMHYFRADSEGRDTPFIDAHNCGTSGGALGWAPFVEGLEPIKNDYYETWDHLCWEVYGYRVFPDLSTVAWSEVFGASLSSDKSEVIQRLRDKANELENQS